MKWLDMTIIKRRGNGQRKNDPLTVRYEALYGKAEGERRAGKDRRSMRMGYIALVAAFAAVMVFSVWAYMHDGQNVSVSKDGRLISITRPQEGKGTESVDVRVRADNGRAAIVQDKELFVDEVNGGEKDDEEGIMRGESESDKLGRRIDSAARSLNEDTASKVIYLPEKTEDGTRLTWEFRKKNDMPLIVFVFAIAFAALYMGRFSRIKKEEKEAGDSIRRQLPEFINKTVLLLEGGIVINEALLRVIRDRKDMDGGYFYSQLSVIEQRSRKTNTAVHEQLQDFARRSGVRELMRIANIISDNIGKGSDLTGKLAHESSMLWFARKKQAEENGRLSETKMTLPLVMLIGVLVMLTIAPALMEI